MRKYLNLTILAILILAFISKSAIAAEPLIQATFSVYPTTIYPGNDGYIQLTLKNSGTASANRIKVSSVSWDRGITPFGNWIGEIGALAAGDSSISIYKFSVSNNASSGLYSISFTIDYCQDSSCRTINPNAIIAVQAPSTVELTSINPTSLKLGERVNLTFTITNKGSAQINNVIFTWSSSGNAILPLGSDNRIVIPKIDANSYYEIPVKVSVSPSAAPGLYSLSISMQYQDRSGANQSISSVAGIEVGGETDFDLSLQESTSTLTTLAITNIGTTTAYSTVVRIPQQENFRVVGSSSSVIGNLNAGDYTLVSFQIVDRNFTSAPASATRNLLVEISYTDSIGIRRTVEKEVEIGLSMNATAFTRTRTTQPQFSMSNGMLYIIIGIAGIIGAVLLLKVRKWMKRKR
jgi:hypothetical protein